MKKTSRKAKPQILPPPAAWRCDRCHEFVKWRVVSVYKCADGKHMIKYLKCPTPGCGGCARQIADIPQGAAATRRTKRSP